MISCKDWQDVTSHHSLAQWYWRRSGSCRTNDGWETAIGGTGQRGEDTALASQHAGGEDRVQRGETNGVFRAGSPERSRWAEARCCQASQRRRLRVATLRPKCERRRIRDRNWRARLRTRLVRSFGGVPTTSQACSNTQPDWWVYSRMRALFTATRKSGPEMLITLHIS